MILLNIPSVLGMPFVLKIEIEGKNNYAFFISWSLPSPEKHGMQLLIWTFQSINLVHGTLVCLILCSYLKFIPSAKSS